VENVVCGERVAIIANDTEAIDHAFALSAPMRLGRPNATRRVDHLILQKGSSSIPLWRIGEIGVPASEAGHSLFFVLDTAELGFDQSGDTRSGSPLGLAGGIATLF
jgi:hypothetical protein